MPKTATPLQRAAAEQDDAEKVKEAKGLFARLAALFGSGADASAAPNARMTKKTLTTKRVEMEESDDDMEEEEEEKYGDEEEEAMDSATDEPSKTDDSAPPDEEGEAEEEEEKAIAKARAQAMKAADAAYAKAIEGHPLAAALAIRSPRRVEREVRKATGAKTIGAAMTVLSRERAAAETASARLLTAQAETEQRVNRIERDAKRDKVNALVAQGKREMRAGATTKDGREALREYGMKFGPTKLAAFLAAQPKLARSTEEDGALRENVRKAAAAQGEVNADAILDSLTAGMSPEAKAKAVADFKQRMNGASGANGGAK